jgi:hypothetical protein
MPDSDTKYTSLNIRDDTARELKRLNYRMSEIAGKRITISETLAELLKSYERQHETSST